MPVPSLITFIAGQKVKAVDLNNNTVTAFNQTVLNKPICHIFQTSAQSTTSGSLTQMTMNATKFDTDSMADLTNSRINFNTGGIYRVTAQVCFNSNATGYRFGVLMKNTPLNGAGGFATACHAATGTDFRMSFTALERFTAGQYVLLGATQSSGAALSTNIGLGSTFLSVEWVSA